MAASSTTTLGNGGKLFFGSLCAGTFGLGCWQMQRLVEKRSLMEERNQELRMDPTTSLNLDDAQHAFQRRILTGTFRHDREVLIGPRGAPAGVQVPRKGLSAKSSKASAGGGAPGPQGFHVLTPFQLNSNGERSMVWVNRGWVPKTMVPNSDYARASAKSKHDLDASNYPQWTRPDGSVEVTTILSKTEKPRVISPEHDYSTRPLRLFWLDALALQALAESEDETVLMVQIKDEEEELQYPMRPPLDAVAEFKTTPEIHAGYAATWFGLSGAGVYMMRKMLTKGRG